MGEEPQKKRGRKKSTVTGELRPLELLGLEGAKGLKKGEIERYLQQHGITPAATKPQQKAQLRELMLALGIQRHPSTAALRQQFDTKQPADSSAVYSAASSSALAAAAEPWIKCVDCSHRANRECPYSRCKPCCVAAMRMQGYSCVSHLRILQQQQQHSPDEPGVPTAIPWPTGTHPFEPPFVHHPNLAFECPRCRAVVGQLGAQPWLHMRECCCADGWAANTVGTLRLNAAPTPVDAAVESSKSRRALYSDVLARVFSSQPISDVANDGNVSELRRKRLKRTVDELCDVVSSAPAFQVTRAQRQSGAEFDERVQQLCASRESPEQLHTFHASLVSAGVLDQPRIRNHDIRVLIRAPTDTISL